MAVRIDPPFNSRRFIGNKITKEVHDVYVERILLCKIDEIRFENIITFTPDTLEQTHQEGYKNCRYCLSGL